MQICEDHWHELKNAIRQRGMWRLVAEETGAVYSPVQEGQGQRRSGDLDPLMMTSLLISEQALMAFGSYLLTHRCCPLCEVEFNLGKGLSFDWIDFDADQILQVCKERHLIESEH